MHQYTSIFYTKFENFPKNGLSPFSNPFLSGEGTFLHTLYSLSVSLRLYPDYVIAKLH